MEPKNIFYNLKDNNNSSSVKNPEKIVLGEETINSLSL